ncbi:MAG: hypothetical protein IKU39_08600 [Lachnospiraceae bacterium]|nr:hypothetical protein [Lachnospiraceae bacterium]
MNETVEIWINELLKQHGVSKLNELPACIIKSEIEDAKGTISNEHLWELGYAGKEPWNPHTENIMILLEYIEELTFVLEEN